MAPFPLRTVLLLLTCGLLAAAAALAAVAVRAFRAESRALQVLRGTLRRPSLAGLSALEDVDFRARDGARIKGWYQAPRNGALVLLGHGSGSERTQVILQAQLLARRGYGVLLFDWPGHGESEGRFRAGEAEILALEAALAFATEHAALGRVGAYGFSLGACVVLELAARDPRLMAIAVEGVPTDLDEALRYEYRAWGVVAYLGARLAFHRAGVELHRLVPRIAITRLSPRPVLVIAGADDPGVSEAMARRLFAAAGEPKDLWLVPGAGHGDAVERQPAEYARRLTPVLRPKPCPPIFGRIGPVTTATAPPKPPVPRRRLRIGKLAIDAVSFAEALEDIRALVGAGRGGSVFTPNVDHIVLTDRDRRLEEAYASVSLSLVDGVPVMWASRLLGAPLPEKVSGSDLVEPLLALAADEGWRVYLLGGGPGVAEEARRVLSARFPKLSVVGAEGPMIDMETPGSARRPIVERLAAARPHLVLVALGNPKQELFIHENREALCPAVLVAVGAALDFVAGAVPRAPAWVSVAGLEWLYRLVREPQRLWRRYLLRDPWFLPILLRTWRERRRLRAQEAA